GRGRRAARGHRESRRQNEGAGHPVRDADEGGKTLPAGRVLNMSHTVPITEIAGQKLSGEQSAYLDGFFSGLRNRGLSFGEVLPNPAAQPGAPVKPNLEELTPEERIKHELHPLDAYPLLLQHA